MSVHLKRHRTPSQSSTSLFVDADADRSPTKTPKILPDSAVSNSSNYPSQCNLPPTCNHQPIALTNLREFESHYATYHAHVCEYERCGVVFPDPRLLELHQTECHDPLAAARKERGEKIFACHLASCGKLFSTPKGRRLHLIQAHGYPKEYFFAVTNKGIGGLLKKWGEGASLIRKPWKERYVMGNDGGDSEVNSVVDDAIDSRDRKVSCIATKDDEFLDGIVNGMNSLSIVPPSIKFGRGAMKGVRRSGLRSQLNTAAHVSLL